MKADRLTRLMLKRLRLSPAAPFLSGRGTVETLFEGLRGLFGFVFFFAGSGAQRNVVAL